MGRVVARFLVTAVAAFVALAAGGTAAQAGQQGMDFDVLHLNIWGHVGNADSEEEVQALVDNLTDLVHDRQPDLVSLNEVCKSQADGLRESLAGEYQVYASLAWWPAVQKPACGGEFGRAILVRDELTKDSKAFAKQLPVDEERDLAKRPIVCLAMEPLRTLFCSTHLTAGSSDAVDQERALQVEKIHATFAPYNARDWNIILGADMNMRPNDPNLDSIYEPSYGDGAYGIYREAHPDRTTKEETHQSGAPIDYIFINDQPISISRPLITPVDYSDHHVYEASVRIQQ
jgi:endonuclease/exonuclease/phosphatase family metal-dependent hydrolase